MANEEVEMNSQVITIEKRTAYALELKKGGHIKIDQSQGPQIAVIVAINRRDPLEFFSQGNTRLSLALGPYKRQSGSGTIPYWIEKGDMLLSNRWNPMLALIEDTYGKHDIVFDPCDSYFNTSILRQSEGYPGCRGLHAEALKPWHVGYDAVPAGVNLFQNTVYKSEGMLTFPTQTVDSAMVVFQAHMDLVVSVTACPCPLGENHDVRMEIY
jgi:uncharacterized protein YcgI (DUF1989 family)